MKYRVGRFYATIFIKFQVYKEKIVYCYSTKYHHTVLDIETKSGVLIFFLNNESLRK